jgi:prolyl-tRNA editing enzyme YbaK/EbsC (Cys-tRNA(Pro) deacylase)
MGHPNKRTLPSIQRSVCTQTGHCQQIHALLSLLICTLTIMAKTTRSLRLDHSPLGQLAANLDALGARRRMLPVSPGLERVDDVAASLRISVTDIVVAQILEAEGDYLAVLASASSRFSLRLMGEILGAKRVRFLGPARVRAWLAHARSEAPDAADTSTLHWWEVPAICGLPTVIDQGLAGRGMVYAATGDAQLLMRITVDELKRVTGGFAGDLTGRAGVPPR